MRVRACALIVVSSLGCADILGLSDAGEGGEGHGGGSTTGTTTSTTGGGGSGGDGGSGASGGQGGTGATGGGGTGGGTAGTGGGGGAGGTGGSGGGSTSCIPNTVEACFDGPPEIDGIGECQAGSRTCGPDGAWGPCLGHVKPSFEDCGDNKDQSCDGETECSGGYRWAQRFSTSQTDRAWDVATSLAGSTVIVGESAGAIKLGSTTHPNMGGSDAFVAQLDNNGAVLWSQTFGGSGEDSARSVAVSDAGEIFVAGLNGNCAAGCSFGGETLIAPSGGFVAKLDAAGNVAWVQGLGDIFDVNDIAVSPTGSVAVAGDYFGFPIIGPGQVLADGGASANGFVAKIVDLGAVGLISWVRGYGDTSSSQSVTSVSIGPSDEVIFAMNLSGSADLNLDLLGLPASYSAADQDILVAGLLGMSGAHQWSRHYVSSSSQKDAVVRAIPGPGGSLEVLVAASFNGAVDLGGSGACGSQNAIGTDAAIWKLGAGGNCLWAVRPASTGPQNPSGIEVDAGGNILVTGNFMQELDFSGGAEKITSFASGLFVAKLKSDGKFVWQRAFGTQFDATLRPSADPIGGLVLAGQLTTFCDFGGGVVGPASGNSDVVVVGLRP